ncbi:hypothetical protein [Lacinutrix sp. MEBiC02404]
MKLNILALIILLTTIGCSKNKTTTYIGNINNAVNGEIRISNNENDIQGVFYNSDKDSEIQLKGIRIGNKLTLEEYTKNNVISGFFEGEIDNDGYNGSWFNPDKTIQVPFTFKLKTPKLNSDEKKPKTDKSLALNLDQEKLNKGIEKRNIFLYELLSKINLSLEKEKSKLINIKNDSYSSRVQKEKNILKTEKSIEDLEVILSAIRNRIANQQLTTYFEFQKKPNSLVKHIYTSFLNSDFSKLEFLFDPYGEYSDAVEPLMISQIVVNNMGYKNKFEQFKTIKFEIINTRIDNNIAYVLVNAEKEYDTDETLFTLINRNEIWYLKDISN